MSEIKEFIDALAELFGDLGNKFDEAWHLEKHTISKDYENCKICRWELDYERSMS